jgi:Na+/citrate or Na+/malate symporter
LWIFPAAASLDPKRAFFLIVVPIMAGGVGEGAIPLSIGYSEILHRSQGDLFAEVLPPVMLGSLTAILLSGFLNFVGRKFPSLTGGGITVTVTLIALARFGWIF